MRNLFSRNGMFRFAFLCLAVSCLLPEVSLAQKKDLQFIYRYGVGKKNELNTFERTYTRDMVTDPAIMIPFRLKKKDLERIAAKMESIGLFSYPSAFTVNVPAGENVCMQDPFESFYYKVSYQGKVHEIWWADNICNKDEKAANLRELNRLIEEIISSQKSYRNLPKPQGSYH